MDERNLLLRQIHRFKKRIFLNRLIRKVSLFLLLSFLIFTLASLMEFTFRLNTTGRLIIFITILISAGYLLFRFILAPLEAYLRVDKKMSDDEAARQLSGYIPGLEDRLLNYLQLRREAKQNDLLIAAIEQKTKSLSVFRFEDAISIRQDLRNFLISFVGISTLVILGSVPFKNIFLEPTSRIVQFNKTFVPPSPYEFNWINSDETLYFGESASLKFDIGGSALAEDVYILINRRKIKLSASQSADFEYFIDKVYEDKLGFQLQCNGYLSQRFSAVVTKRPTLNFLQINLDYPDYTGRDYETISNTGNAEVPEGTILTWSVDTEFSDSVFILNNEMKSMLRKSGDTHVLQRQVLSDFPYEIRLFNASGTNSDKLLYEIEIIEDQYPELDVNVREDTLRFNYILLSGSVADDYGINSVKLHYAVDRGEEKVVSIPSISDNLNQPFYYQWFLDSLSLSKGSQITYYLSVSDNDAVNGSKTTKSRVFNFGIPSSKTLAENASKSAQNTDNQLDKTLQQAEDLNEQIKELQENLRGKRRLSWEDEKEIREMLAQKEILKEQVEQLKKQIEDTRNKTELSTENQELAKRAQELQQLMDEVLDEETRRLYEELERLMDEQYQDINEINENVEELDRKQENTIKSLERSIEMFKKFKFDLKADEIIQEAAELEQALDSLSNEIEDMSNADENEVAEENKLEESNNSELDSLSEEGSEGMSEEMKERAEELKQQMEELMENMEELREINESRNKPQDIEEAEEAADDAEQSMQDAEEEMQQNNQQEGKKKLEEGSQSLQKLQQSLQQSQSMSGETLQVNIQNLRNILDNLVTLSFDQEEIIQQFRGVTNVDPLYYELGEQQLALLDDSEIVYDSVAFLAEQIFAIQTVAMKELEEMKYTLEKSLEYIRAKEKGNALVNQQLAMSHMNKLANILSEILDQLQNASSGSGEGQSQKNDPNLSQLQQQLNQKIRELKRSGKSGRELSEELARLAAEQERIREALEKMGIMEQRGGENGKGENGNGEGGVEGENGEQIKQQILDEMLQNEIDLVNKRINDRLINRQEQLLERLMDFEKASNERGEKEEREGETAQDLERVLPPDIEEYLKSRQSDIELLKTVPGRVNPYYKSEINEYFKRLSNQDK